jgi:hypothetical protein
MGNRIYSGEVEELEGRMPLGDGECVALVQQLTSVGPTIGWRPGPRVVDLSYLNPGAVIANFVFDSKGAGRFPNRHGYHAALFVEFGPRGQSTGRPSQLWIMDQWRDRDKNTIHKRNVEARGERSHAQGNPYNDADNADQYYVVMV